MSTCNAQWRTWRKEPTSNSGLGSLHVCRLRKEDPHIHVCDLGCDATITPTMLEAVKTWPKEGT